MKVYINVIVLISIIKIVVADDNIVKKAKELENEKKELYNQINAAIEDSVKEFRKSNNSKSITGLKYMEELKKQITKFNKTDNDSDIADINADIKSDLENRRKLSFKDLINPKKEKKDKDLVDLEHFLKPKKTSGTEWKKIVENRIKVQMKLDDWLLNKQKERDRLKEYRLQKKRLILAGKYEICPRFGYSGSKKDVEEEKKDRKGNKNKNSKKIKYPCCRKCCKRSYMGCL